MYNFTVYNSNINFWLWHVSAFTFKTEESKARINSQALSSSNNTPFHNAHMLLYTYKCVHIKTEKIKLE